MHAGLAPLEQKPVRARKQVLYRICDLSGIRRLCNTKEQEKGQELALLSEAPLSRRLLLRGFHVHLPCAVLTKLLETKHCCPHFGGENTKAQL